MRGDCPRGRRGEATLARTEVLLEEGEWDSAAREMNGLQGWAGVLARDWVGEVRRVLEVWQAVDVSLISYSLDFLFGLSGERPLLTYVVFFCRLLLPRHGCRVCLWSELFSCHPRQRQLGRWEVFFCSFTPGSEGRGGEGRWRLVKVRCILPILDAFPAASVAAYEGKARQGKARCWAVYRTSSSEVR